MKTSNKSYICILFFLILSYFLPIVIAAATRNEQKAIDALFSITSKYSEKLSAVFGEKARNSDGKEFPCHIYEVSQYEQNLAAFGPPIALSTAISFSNPDEEYSGIYITVYVLNSSEKTAEFLKMMSDDWIPSSTFHNLPAIEIKTSDQVSNFFFICGRYIFREELFNTKSLREEMYAVTEALKMAKDTKSMIVESTGEQDIPPVEPEAPSAETETTEIIADLNESEEEPAPEEVPAAEDETEQVEGETTTGESEAETTEEPAKAAETEPSPPETAVQPAAEEQLPSMPPVKALVTTPYESWMNSWKVVSSFSKTKYVYENISAASAPPGGGYKMIVLKPKDSVNPAILEGRFKPKTYQSGLYIRLAGIRNAEASALISIEVNGYPIIKEKRISGTEGWQEMNVNIGALNPSFSVVIIKVYPDPYGKAGLDMIFIDDISVDGSPVFDHKFKLSAEGVAGDEGEEPHISVQGLWTDLRNFNYNVRQKGNKFTFSCTEKLDDFLWEVSGEGVIHSSIKLSITFTEKYRPLGRIMTSTAAGTYDKSKKMIIWNSHNKRFPGEWFFIR